MSVVSFTNSLPVIERNDGLDIGRKQINPVEFVGFSFNSFQDRLGLFAAACMRDYDSLHRAIVILLKNQIHRDAVRGQSSLRQCHADTGWAHPY